MVAIRSDLNTIGACGVERQVVMPKICAKSFERYDGGAAVKRIYGSSTVTRFFVYFAADEHDPTKTQIIEGYGATSGERRTYAIARFKATVAAEVT